MNSRVLCGLLVAAIGAGCATGPRRQTANPCAPSAPPPVSHESVHWHLFDVTVVEPLEQSLHLLRMGRKLLGMPIRAHNLKDGRLTSSIFIEERDPASLTPEQVRWGPTRPEDVAHPPFTITKMKDVGKTAGFFVTDARGVRYLFKLDPVAAPELLSGAEVVASKLLYTLGYHVPSYEIVLLRPDELKLPSELSIKGPGGAQHPFAATDLEQLVHDRAGSDGRLRVVASKILDGEILGPASFKQLRDCAEVRALKVAYAWLNDIDAKDHNSLVVRQGGRMVGYLIDFGTALGADAGRGGPKTPCAGWTYIVDLAEASEKLVTLGRHRSGCDPREQPIDAHLGLFSPRVDPDQWKPYAPNLAFKAMTEDDSRWIAQRLARLSRAQIGAAVSAGQYSDPSDAARLIELLDRRRLTIVQHYLGEHWGEQQEARQ